MTRYFAFTVAENQSHRLPYEFWRRTGPIFMIQIGITGAHGFLWDSGTVTTIDAPGTSVTYASGINRTGQIVDTRDIEILRNELKKWAAKKGKTIAIVP